MVRPPWSSPRTNRGEPEPPPCERDHVFDRSTGGRSGWAAGAVPDGSVLPGGGGGTVPPPEGGGGVVPERGSGCCASRAGGGVPGGGGVVTLRGASVDGAIAAIVGPAHPTVPTSTSRHGPTSRARASIPRSYRHRRPNANKRRNTERCRSPRVVRCGVGEPE